VPNRKRAGMTGRVGKIPKHMQGVENTRNTNATVSGYKFISK